MSRTVTNKNKWTVELESSKLYKIRLVCIHFSFWQEGLKKTTAVYSFCFRQKPLTGLTVLLKSLASSAWQDVNKHPQALVNEWMAVWTREVGTYGSEFSSLGSEYSPVPSNSTRILCDYNPLNTQMFLWWYAQWLTSVSLPYMAIKPVNLFCEHFKNIC